MAQEAAAVPPSPQNIYATICASRGNGMVTVFVNGKQIQVGLVLSDDTYNDIVKRFVYDATDTFGVCQHKNVERAAVVRVWLQRAITAANRNATVVAVPRCFGCAAMP